MSSTSVQQFPLDTNHLGVRIAVLATMLIGGTLGLFVVMPAVVELVNVIAPASACLIVIGSLILGIGGAWVVERVLRQVWPSGRWLGLSGAMLTLSERSGDSKAVDLSQPISIHSWHFVVTRGRTWVPKGWYCMAYRVTQGEVSITPYTFIDPKNAEPLPQWSAFEELISRKRAPKRGEEHLLQKVSEQGELREAEENRWQDGAEMLPDDFVILLDAIDQSTDTWPVQSE